MAQNKGPIHIGTSGYNYPHWKGPFYPEHLPQKQFLQHYIKSFDSVEINNSFYRLPTQKTFAAWRQATPPGFRFAVKASRYITHMKKLKDPRKGLDSLLSHAGSLQEKLAAVLFQLPPGWKYNPERLDAFLDELPEGLASTFEFRNTTWITDRTLELLRTHNIAFCIYELAGYRSPIEVTAPLVYIRLHGPGDKYQGSYTPQALRAWADRIIEWSDTGHTVMCYFDNDQNGYAVLNAIKLKEMIEK